MDEQNQMPNELADPAAAPSTTPTSAPALARSPRERALVWSAIGLLLILVVVEGTSQYQFRSSLERLEAAILSNDNTATEGGIHSSEVDQHIRGITFRDERTFEVTNPTLGGGEMTEIQQKKEYSWPSLFKTYRLIVTVNSFERAILVQAALPTEEL